MPIEQHRLYRVIQCARTYQLLFRQFRQFADQLVDDCQQGRITPSEMAMRLSQQLTITPRITDADEIIAEEVQRYNYTRRRSIADRQRKQAERAADGKFIPITPDRIPQHSTNPNFPELTRAQPKSIQPMTEIVREDKFTQLEREVMSDPEVQRIHAQMQRQRAERGNKATDEAGNPIPDLDDTDIKDIGE